MNRKNNNLKVTKDPFYYYRWEFLRRNESYKKDYDAFINEKNETKKKELRKDITARSGLFSPADYRTNYPDFAQSVEKSGNDSKGRAEKHVIKVSELPEAIVFTQQFRPSSILRTDAWSKQALSEKFSLQNIDFKDIDPEDMPYPGMKTLRLAIDITRPKKVLLDNFEELISFYKDLSQRVSSRQRPMFYSSNYLPFLDTQRKRFNEYYIYLKIFDLRKEGKTLREIAKIIYPEDYEKLVKYKSRSEKYAVLPVTEKAKNNLRACQALIEASYKIIS